jgi:hypothetical protein
MFFTDSLHANDSGRCCCCAVEDVAAVVVRLVVRDGGRGSVAVEYFIKTIRHVNSKIASPFLMNKYVFAKTH